MKARIIGIISAVVILCAALLLFFSTRIWTDLYTINTDGDTISFKNDVFVRQATSLQADSENLGSTIGIAVFSKRSITDYIWPTWVMEYEDDREHNRIFVRTLMDPGSVYVKQPSG